MDAVVGRKRSSKLMMSLHWINKMLMSIVDVSIPLDFWIKKQNTAYSAMFVS